MTRSAERQHLEEALGLVMDLSGEEAAPGVRVNFPEKVKEMFAEGDNQIHGTESKMVRALSRITGLPEEKLTIAEAADLLLEAPTTREDAIAFLKEEAERLEPNEMNPNRFRDETVDALFLLQAVRILEKHGGEPQ